MGSTELKYNLVGSISAGKMVLSKAKPLYTSMSKTRKTIRDSGTMQRLDVRSQAPGFLEPVKFYHGRRIYQPGEENETRGERMSQFFGLT